MFGDKYGRETPVFTSRGASVYVPWQEKDGVKNASKSLQLNVSTAANFPEWVDSLKFFVKETKSLDTTKKHYIDSQSLTGVELKEFSLLYLVMNNLNLLITFYASFFCVCSLMTI